MREGFVGSVATAHRAMSGMQTHCSAKPETFLCEEKTSSRINRRAATRETGSTVHKGEGS